MSRASLVDGAILGLLIGVAVVAHLVSEPFIITLATKAAIFALAGVGLNLVLGYGGLVSFGHAAFFGIGGYVAGILASHAMSGEPIAAWPFAIGGSAEMLVIWPAAMVLSGLAAALIGALVLRTSGVYFIMATLAFAQMLYYFAISWPAYGGEDGLSFYVRNRFPGLNTFDPIQFFALAAAILMLALGLSSMIVRARFGMALRATRANPARAVAVGIRPFGIRLAAFVLSGMLTGLAGALYADLNRFVSPAMLSWHMSGEIMAFVILGGVGRLMGPVAGAGAYIVLEHLLGGVSDHWQALLGVLLILIVLRAPGGIVGTLRGGDGR